eukprot:COSAG02_NODE_4184_length_5655_cov_2.189885_4_plen_112_part_00
MLLRQVSHQCEDFSCGSGYEAWVWLKLTTGDGSSFDLQALKDFESSRGDAQGYLDQHFPNSGGSTIDVDTDTGLARLSADEVIAEPLACFFEPDVMVKVKQRAAWPSPAGT